MSKPIREYSVWLDAMRGLASLVVFVGHARVVLLGSVVGAIGVAQADSSSVRPEAAAEATSFGHEAVIVFFILSGYLVGGGVIRAYRTGRWNGADYFIARLSRLWTVLIPILLLGYVVDHVGMAMAGPHSIYMAPPGQRMVFSDLAERVRLEALIGNALFLQTILVPTYGTNSPLWSLAYEFWFYVALPILMFTILPGRTLRSRAIGAVALIMIGVFVGTNICIYFLFWLMGAAIELMPQRIAFGHQRWLAALGSVIFVVLLGILYKARLPLIASDAIESIACTALCYAIVHLREPMARGFVTAVAGGISALSYTLYLVHAPAIAFLSNLLMPAWYTWPVNALGVAKFSGTCLLVLAISGAIYWCFERNTPIVRGWLRNRLPGKSG